MTHIDPCEITASRLNEGAEYVFIQPRDDYEFFGLTGKAEGDGEQVVVLLGERGRYDTTLRSECKGISGAMILNPVVRVNLGSAFDPDLENFTGAILRKEDKLILMGANRRFIRGRIPVVLKEGLPHTDKPVGFRHWYLVKEEKDGYVELFSADIRSFSETS